MAIESGPPVTQTRTTALPAPRFGRRPGRDGQAPGRAHGGCGEPTAFLGSSGLIAALLASTTIGTYPYPLRSQPVPERSLPVTNAAAAPTALLAATLWPFPGAALLLLYLAVVYRVFKGRVVLDQGARD